MRAQLSQRLDELKKEYAVGQAKMNDLEAQQARLRETMLRISGAIQVLEEVLRNPGEEPEQHEPANAAALA